MKATGTLLLASVLLVVSCIPKSAGVTDSVGQSKDEPKQEVRAYRELKLTQSRMNGDDVLQLQQKLLSMHFGEVDGWYGPMTEKAVRRFQLYFGFASDGVVRESMWNALLSPSDIGARFGSDIATISSYVLADPAYEEDINPGPFGRTNATWYAEGKKVKAAVVELITLKESALETLIDNPATRSIWKVFPLEGRYLVFKEKNPSSEIELALEDVDPYYYVDKKIYRIINGMESVVSDISTQEDIGYITSITGKLPEQRHYPSSSEQLQEPPATP